MRGLTSFLMAVTLALTAGCGGDAGADRTDPAVVFRSGMIALAKGDLGALHGLLTPAGRRALLSDLRAFRDSLRLPAAARVGVGGPEDGRPSDASVAAARQGRPADALALLIALRPVAVPAAPRNESHPGGARVYFYRDAQDVERRVVLVRGEAGWLIDRIDV